MSDNIGKVFNLGAGGGQGDLTLEAADERYLQKSGGSIEARSAFVLEHIQEYADIPSVRLSINAQEELVEGAPFVARVSKDDNFVSELNLYESGVHLHSGAMPDCRSRISVYDPMTITDGVSDIIVMEVEQYNTRTGIYIRHGEVALQIGDSDLDYPSSYFSFNPDHITWTSPDRPPVCITCFDTGYDGLKVSINGDNIVTESMLNNYDFEGEIPPGVIVMWSGAVSEIPNGWVLCDGDNGTPCLLDRFVVGAGSTYNVGDTGGEATHKLTVLELPRHVHSLNMIDKEDTLAPVKNILGTKGNSYGSNNAMTGVQGDNNPHNNMPPYYALCYIMKI
ncbi:MAG: hypothetical protein HFF83_01050 [Oscillibacter sp.]|jgi:microcystin-dependent protein|nr:hypothetical protein [Oscillibacter sp.]